MKVLLVSWAWRPVGGDWTYVDNMKRLYESNGYEVIPFSTQHESNFQSEYEKHFVKGYDYKELNKKKSLRNGLLTLKNSIVSFDALNKLDNLLEEHKISFVHLHLIHHWITPAIIWKLKRRKIPIIWTLHEYKILCPEGSFVSNGKVCEKCFSGKFYNCAVNRCKKTSFLASALASFDAYFYHTLNVYRLVDAYLCPSSFLLRKFQQFGFNLDKLHLTNYCYDIDFIDKSANMIKESMDDEVGEKFILYVGRIEAVKGIKTLINAVEGTDINLKIVGTGAALEEMRSYAMELRLENITFLGFQDKEMVYRLTMQSLCVVCPSEWYENYPFSVIESLLLSKAVIGSRIGGIPELVVDGETGLLFEPEDFLDLRKKMLLLWENREFATELGHAAREFAISKVHFETHWRIMEAIIEKLGVNSHQELQPELDCV